jgi:hypothetical protein
MILTQPVSVRGKVYWPLKPSIGRFHSQNRLHLKLCQKRHFVDHPEEGSVVSLAFKCYFGGFSASSFGAGIFDKCLTGFLVCPSFSE